MIATIVGLSVLSIVIVMIASGGGSDMSTGVWPMLVLIGYVGLPLAFLLIVTFLIVSARRRRTTRDGGR
jgi:hypothetical protein